MNAKDFYHEDLLLLDEGHCLRDQALAVCQTNHDPNRQSFRATSLETLRHMVAANLGVTFMPALACDKNRGVAYIPFKNPKPSRTIGLVFRKSSTRKVLMDVLAKQIKQALAKSQADVELLL